MVKFPIFGGKRIVKEKWQATKTYSTDTLKQIKNAMGVYLGRNVEIKKGNGKYKEEDGRLVLIDDEWESEEEGKNVY